MKQSQESRPGLRVIAFTSLAHFANDGASFFVPVMIDLVAVAYGVDILLVAASNFLLWFTTAVSAIFFGPMIDRRNLRVEGMALGLLALSVGLVLFSVALEGVLVPVFLLVSAVVAGFGASFYHPLGGSILQSYYKGRHTGRYLGINGSAGSLGRALYPVLLLLVGSALASNVLSVQFFGVLGVVFAVVVFVGIRGYASAEAGGPPAPQAPEEPGPSVETSGTKTMTPSIVLLTVISFIRSVAFFGIVSFLPEYISFEKGAGASLSLGALTTLMYVGGIVGQLAFGKLVEDHDRRVVLAASTFLSALFLLAYLLTSGTVSLLALALFGFMNFSGFPVFMSLISDYIKGTSTTGNAIVWNLGNTGGRAAGPLVVGLLIVGSYSNLPFAFEVSLVAAVVSALMTMKLPKPAKASRTAVLG